MFTSSRKPAIRRALITVSGGEYFLKVCCFYFFLLMSPIYRVLGSTRCPKIKKHPGIKLKPVNKAKEPFLPGDLIIFSCETTEYAQVTKCLDDGRWSDIPHCPDPSNSFCPDLRPIPHGSYNTTGPYKFGTVVAVSCNHENFSGNSINDTTTDKLINPSLQTIPNNSSTLVRYNLQGTRNLRCTASSKWSHEPPVCSPLQPDTQSNAGLWISSFFLTLVPLLILVAIAQMLLKWKRRRQQRERWKQYFTDYKYRYSKTSMTFANRPKELNSTVPVTDL